MKKKKHMYTIIDDIFTEKNLNLALENLSSKKDSCGTDGVRVSEIRDYWNKNKEKIIDSIYNQKYEVGVIKQTEILAPNKKRRTISTMNSVDRLVARAIHQVVEPVIDSQLSDRCFAYRKNLGTGDMAECVAEGIENGNNWVMEMDIKEFFDTIPHDKMIKKLKEVIDDDRLVKLIYAFIHCKVDNDGDVHYLNQGLLQGSPLSPALSNLYLSEIDRKLEQKYSTFCRYGDDIRIVFSSMEAAEYAQKEVEDLIVEEGLRLNRKKSGIYNAINRTCLGYEFFEKGGHIYAQHVERKRSEVYSKWKQDSVRKSDKNYHIVNDGILTRKDFTVLFENEEGKFFLPIETMDSLSIYSGAAFSANFFSFANEERLLVDIISNSGGRVGTFVPEFLKSDRKVEMAQIMLINNDKEHLRIAKVYQKANVFNLRANLRYYERRGNNQRIKDTVDCLTEIIEKIGEIKSIDSAMMYEAQARQKYYMCFNEILQNEDFKFIKRTRRPPEDPLNAMISFGNTLLYTRFANEIYRSSLDIRFGLLHNSDRRAESLNLDLADLFKPVLIDRTIFTLVNRKMLDAGKDFRSLDGGGIYLSNDGKRIFIKEMERKLHQKVRIKNEMKTYEQLMRDEVRNLSAFFRGKVDYRPYRYVN